MTIFRFFLLKIIQLRVIYYMNIFLLYIYTKKDSYKGILKKTLPITSSSKSKYPNFLESKE